MLSGISLYGGELRIIGESQADSARVWTVKSTICAELNGDRGTFAADKVEKIIFHGLDGDDRFENDTNIPCEATGGNGNDVLMGGSANDVLHGLAGNDRLIGAEGCDQLFGESGNDGLFGGQYGKPDFDVLHGGAGKDRFLLGSNDQVSDQQPDDVEIRLVNGSDDWTNREVEIVDEVFARLQEAVDSTAILKDTLSTEPIKMVKEAAGTYDPDEGGSNEFSVQRKIHLSDWAESDAEACEAAARALVHQIAHNWGSLNGGNSVWSAFVSEHLASNGADSFARAYGETGAEEDWCTCWEARFGYATEEFPATPSPKLASKLALIDEMFAACFGNTAPEITDVGFGSEPIVGGKEAVFSGSFTDQEDFHTVTVDWGDGSSPEIVVLSPGVYDFDLAHTYPYPDGEEEPVYTWTVTLCDGLFGASDTKTEQVTVCPIPGDVNLDGNLNLTDAINILGYLFQGWELDPYCIVDANGDNHEDIADAIFVLNYLFGNGPSPWDVWPGEPHWHNP
jgi:hypothetical protein